MSYIDRGVKFVRYYWCVNCGYHGDFKFERERNIKCEKCGYEHLCELDEEDFKEYTKHLNPIDINKNLE